MVGPPPSTWAVDPAAAGVFEILPRLWQLRLPLTWPGISHVNAYLVELPGGGVALFDCGSAGDPSAWQALVIALGAAGHEVTDVRLLVATHAHSDHIGLARPLVEASGCTFRMHPRHQAFTDGGRDPDRIEAARARRARLEGVPDGELPLFASVAEELEGVELPVPPAAPLADDDAIDTAVGPWQVIETPGHTPSHVCLYQQESGLLVGGDLVGKQFAPFFDYGYSGDPYAELLASLDRIAPLAVERTLPGHGRPIDDLAPVLDEHRTELAARLAAVEAAVAEGPAGGYELAERVFGPPETDYDRVYRLAEILAYVRHLRLAGRVRREVRESRYVYVWAPCEQR